MGNAITLAQNYAKIQDSLYKKASLTANLEVRDEFTQNFDDAGTVQIMNIVTTGLGNYDRATGFPTGSTTVTWVPYTIDNDRGQTFEVDAMDDAEAKKMVFVETVKEFMKQHVIPEIDATRFATMAALGDNTVAADLTSSTTVEAIDAATVIMDDDEVPSEGRTLYITSTGYKNIKQSDSYVRNVDIGTGSEKSLNRNFGEFDGMKVVKVPQSRFYSEIDLEDGTGDVWGYTKTAATGRNINFQIVHDTSVKAITRHAKVRIFGADTNQDKDADKYQTRIYHDLIVPANKTKGIYSHVATA
jgi:hypothetical protein